MVVEVDKPKICGRCRKSGAQMKCPCKSVMYCDTDCQKHHWPEHRGTCTVALVKKLEKHQATRGRDDYRLGPDMLTVARLFVDQDRMEQAEPWALEAIRIFRLVMGNDTVLVQATLQLLGKAYTRQGRLEEALKVHNEELDIARRLNGDPSKNVAGALSNVGATLVAQGKTDAAMQKLEEACAMMTSLFGPDSEEAAWIRGNISNILDKQGRHEEASAMRAAVLGAQRAQQAGGPQGGDAACNDRVAMLLVNQGRSLHEQGRLGPAAAKLEEALAMIRRLHAEKHSSEGECLQMLGAVLRDQGKGNEALPMFEKALRIYRKTCGSQHKKTSSALSSIAKMMAQQGQFEKAVEKYEEATAIDRVTLGPEHDSLALGLYNLGLCRAQMFDKEGALANLGEAKSIYARKGATHQDARDVSGLMEKLQGMVMFNRALQGGGRAR